MSGSVAEAPASPLADWCRWLRRPDFWMPVADTLAVLTAASLPWSTSLVGIFSACWIGAAAMIIDYPAYFRSLKKPAFALPLALLGLAVVGTLWSEAAWSARWWSVGPSLKLLFLPVLFHYFQRSSRGMWVFASFGLSCAVLMALSWVVWIDPRFKLTATLSDGVPVKNYIDQTQEFALCLIALVPVVWRLIHAKQRLLAALCVVVMAGFLANMVFVAFARSALIYIPAMLLILAVRFMSPRSAVLLFAGVAVVAVALWWTSPFLKSRIGSVASEYEQYARENAVTSTGQRLEYWRKSVTFFAAAPVIGNGTGSVLQLFERAAAGHTGVAAEVVRNPHNQTLYVAVQWGLIGVFVLWAMWFSHLLMFRGEGLAAWIGSLVVVQNVMSSLVNSHLFDFHAGWMYVLGVGIAGGMVLKEGSKPRFRPS